MSSLKRRETPHLQHSATTKAAHGVYTCSTWCRHPDQGRALLSSKVFLTLACLRASCGVQAEFKAFRVDIVSQGAHPGRKANGVRNNLPGVVVACNLPAIVNVNVLVTSFGLCVTK